MMGGGGVNPEDSGGGEHWRVEEPGMAAAWGNC